jgi:hypothetical protein
MASKPKKFDADEWLDEKDEAAAAKAAAKAELEAKRRELRDGPDLSLDETTVYKLESHDKYIVTAAMNNTPIDERFWKSIRRYAKANNARIIVAPIRYRNPTSPKEYTLQGEGWWWPEEVVPYLCAATIKLHERLWFIGDMRIGATAVNPLSGLDYVGKGASTIFPHSQVSMRTVPTPQYDLPKCMLTTGTCSVPKYSESKAGAKAYFNHSIGAVAVEKDGNSFHFRHVLADTEGGFYDLDTYYHAKGIKRKQKAAALILGDTHAWWADPEVRNATFDDAESMVNVLKPPKIVHHDLVDAYSVSHHHQKDPITQIAKTRSNRNSLLEELSHVVQYLDETTPKDADLVIVGSNHHDHIRKWVLEHGDWKKDFTNAEIYLELALSMVRSVEMTDTGIKCSDPFASWISERLPKNLAKRTHFIGREKSYRVCGVELCLHGDAGPNGARGSIKNLSRIGTKVVIGHSHSPGIEKGAYQVGTSSILNMDYAKGSPSSWLNTHCVIYPNGKRALLNVIHGRWKA